MLKVTTKSFNQVIAEQSPIIIVFYSEHCNSCPQVIKALENTAQDLEDSKISFGKCNAFQNRAVANSLHISSVPTVYLFKDEQSIPQHLPALPIHELLKSIMKLV